MTNRRIKAYFVRYLLILSCIPRQEAIDCMETVTVYYLYILTVLGRGVIFGECQADRDR
uniref:Uncharacterized protein n=1 Tax=Virgibacillus oceani TaxID=1479511 RepID=A0A917HN19_9BACI|nr:hypothetical protein GCM10011398_31840 [Virgibacillus oceani]